MAFSMRAFGSILFGADAHHLSLIEVRRPGSTLTPTRVTYPAERSPRSYCVATLHRSSPEVLPA